VRGRTVKVARQCHRRNDFFDVRLARCRAPNALPCGDICRALRSGAMRTDAIVRRSLCRALRLHRGPALCRGAGLPCAQTPTCTAKKPPGTPTACQEHRLAPCGSFAICMHTAKRPNVLCRVDTHSKVTSIFLFLLFFIIPYIQFNIYVIIHNNNICSTSTTHMKCIESSDDI
jgi:hypothetical protein